ncbi:CCN family member 1-like isoform X2 [Betta splendens]|uniref:CCN family member 1 n=1 Tax=Betta splendens TaxID=158456 RepID=A0A9W2XD14_BETSP|nr:CCN family member 1-like isoform X2 [Betta splendens]
MWNAFIFQSLVLTLVASCPERCRCPAEVPRCAAGVSLVLDRCGCCKVCARQLFEHCSRTRPCDPTKGLECNFGGLGSAKGICRAKLDGRTCEYNNKIYQNGEVFRPNCRHQCTCMDGAVGCVSLCPPKLLLPKLACSKPERAEAEAEGRGRCCEKLSCVRAAEDDLRQRNELAPVWRGGAESSAVFRRDPGREQVLRRVQCVSRTSSWSPCSRSCGAGVSTRISNNNSRCKLQAETRLCEVRPCNQKSFSRDEKGQKCQRVHKERPPAPLWRSGCRSLQKLRPKHCGSCSDGRCCRPHRTHTVPVRFRCRTGEITQHMVMMIQSCQCDLNCLDGNENTPGPHRHSELQQLKL